jgi:excisionase family DNA binding protein
MGGSTKPALADPDDTFWTLQRAAAYGDCHVNYLRKEAAHGRLRLYRMGTRAIRVKRSEVEALFRPIPTAGTYGGDAG